MNRFNKFLVTLKLTAQDTPVVRYVNQFARLTQPGCIDFVNVVDSHLLPDELLAAQPALLKKIAKRSKRAMRELVRQHLRVPPSCEVRLRVFRGSPVEEILGCARSVEPDLLIVGRDPKNSRSGTVPERLGATAPCSVLVVPKAATPDLRSILGCVDFSPHSREVIQHAVALGRVAELNNVYGLHVYDVPADPFGNGPPREAPGALVESHVETCWEHLIAPLEPDGINLVPIIRRGPFPTLAIKEEARRSRFDLVIIAARGQSVSENAFLGSVSQRVINATETPLLVVKSKPDSTALLAAMLEILKRPKAQESL